jgi:tetratricopeptide (TPR) repeat protein
MMKSFSVERFCVAVAVGLFLTVVHPSGSTAAAPCDPWVAKMVSVQGVVEVRRAGQTQWVPARLNDLYCGGDQVQVGERSRADLALINQPVVRLDQNTTISLGGIREQRVSWFDLVRGALYFFSRMPRNLEVRTAFVNAGVEGTEGLIIVESNRTLITIFEGTVLASNPSGSLTLVGGQSAIAEQGRAPNLTVVVRPRDAVRWAIYYPPSLYFRAEEFPAGPDWQGAVRNSLEAYMKGDFQAAFENIKGVQDTLGEPRFFAYRASLLLAVGRFDEANRDIERALSLNPNYSDAFALQAIVAVAQNEKEKARDVAQRAVTADPKSAAALIALSYAQQANFDLEGALSSLQRAVQLSPENALAWARLAEMWLSFGQLDEALNAAKRAVTLNPNLSRTQTVLGFAFLTQVNTAEARKAFENAIELDQADPLPRLGLGLTIIRDGDLQDGRREIEIAVSLDPDNALIRSYLGKAYYEEKRDSQAAKEYEISKQLDPKDPTPYFYDAIRKQTTNRPVEALEDMQKAIELNDNREVYRSRLLLDSDLAARSAAQARIYSDLGFQQLALVEGWKSVNTDPSNFSAHRFLADSYAVLPRHEIARVSELLQSQLLQPLNMAPIQPHLAESNLFLISAGGPTALSFNEFNPLFNRNGINFQSTGLAGENSTYAGEGVLSGIYKKASFSFGGFHFRTDGWRSNAEQKDSIANAFVQLELSPDTSVQTEYRYRAIERGELRLRFWPDNFDPTENTHVHNQSIRLGFRHAFTSNSQLIGNFLYQTQDRDILHTPVPFQPFLDTRGNRESFSGEAQHLFRSHYIDVVSGVGHFHIDGEDRDAIKNFIPPFTITFLRFANNRDVQHTNVYLYSYARLLKNLVLTFGGSGDFFDSKAPGSSPKNQFNPKVGITWNPFADTTIRGAVFRTLKRTLITDQTLEPTQVAGFNQFFDDFNATQAWVYGAAIDQKLSRNLFAGIEYSRRDLRVPFETTTSGGFTEDKVDWNENLLRTYLLATPAKWVSLTASYEWERFKRDERFANEVSRVETHRLPLGINFFHPSGVGASLRATYVNQHGKFKRIDTGDFEHGDDSFWTIDAGINYRLPNRYGFFTLGVTNLTDRKFKYFDTENGFGNVNPRFVPGRMFFGKLTLAFP